MTIFDLKNKYLFLTDEAKARETSTKNEIISNYLEIIEGKIKLIEEHDSWGKQYYSYLLSDDTGAIYVNHIVSKNNFDHSTIKEPLKVGSTYQIQVKVGVTTYKNELECWLYDKNPKLVQVVEKIDEAPKKRIEFGIHTKMSAYDGMITIDDLEKYLTRNNQQYFGITDRSNVHIYPEIAKLANKGKKPIYGIEMEVLNDEISSILNCQPLNLQSTEYVVFDLETTGLYPAFEDIIEFGAVRVKNGMVLESRQFFMVPNHPITFNVEEITNITNEDIQNGEHYSQLDGLKEIVKFCGNSVLVAHNGINFDFNFLNYKLEEYGMPILNNPMIDTLIISRGLYSSSTNNLGSVSKRLGIEYSKSEAHRADYDANVLSKVWMRMIEDLAAKGSYDLLDLNNFIQNCFFFGRFYSLKWWTQLIIKISKIWSNL